ncbi:MAG: hypothetical protein HOQ18_13275 [Dermatophilaceae bacterium]|nr:hypothetical protein [Dermatophilaceae bacterium]
MSAPYPRSAQGLYSRARRRVAGMIRARRRRLTVGMGAADPEIEPSPA